jgi:MSHA type pilus biogenesis protein MshL
MAYHGIIRHVASITLLIAFFTAAGCSSSSIKQAGQPRSAMDTTLSAPEGRHDPFIKENLQEMKKQPPFPALKTPDYQPVSDDITPAKTRLVNIQARNSALGDILHVIAETAGLNLIINDGVQQDRSITITLKRVTADDALSTVLNAADYFYTISGNTVTVDATGTKTFELGHPAMVQGFNIDVGGDILGSGASLSASGSGGGSTNIKGTISQTMKSDAKAFDFWESLEKSLQGMLGKSDAQSAKVETSSLTNRTSAAGVVSTSQTKTVVEQPPKQILSTPDTGKTGEDAGPRQHLVVNRLTGTIMVTATRKNLHNIESYLNTLRKTLNRQVLVEARVIEVQLRDDLSFGIDWGFISNLKGFGQLAGGYGPAIAGLQAAVDNAAPNFRIGAVTSGTNGSISGLLTALKTQGEVKTLSNPRVNVMNGQSALLSVGRNTNYIAKVTSTTTTTAGSAPTVTYSVETGNVLDGIMLGLVPYINNKGEISMTVTPIVSHLVELADATVGGDPANQIKIKVPTVDLRELSTTIKVRNGEIIVIGGLIQNKQDHKDYKVPLLGDIPWLGTFFTRKDNEDSRTELVVVLQPHLVNND